MLSSVAENLARASGETLAAAQGIDPRYAPQIGDQFAQRANANAAEVILGAWRSFLFVALLAGALLAYLRGALSTRVFGAALALIIGADLWSVARQYWLFSPPARTLYASDPAIELPQEGEPAGPRARGRDERLGARCVPIRTTEPIGRAAARD